MTFNPNNPRIQTVMRPDPSLEGHALMHQAIDEARTATVGVGHHVKTGYHQGAPGHTGSPDWERMAVPNGNREAYNAPDAYVPDDEADVAVTVERTGTRSRAVEAVFDKDHTPYTGEGRTHSRYVAHLDETISGPSSKEPKLSVKTDTTSVAIDRRDGKGDTYHHNFTRPETAAKFIALAAKQTTRRTLE